MLGNDSTGWWKWHHVSKLTWADIPYSLALILPLGFAFWVLEMLLTAFILLSVTHKWSLSRITEEISPWVHHFISTPNVYGAPNLCQVLHQPWRYGDKSLRENCPGGKANHKTARTEVQASVQQITCWVLIQPEHCRLSACPQGACDLEGEMDR